MREVVGLLMTAIILLIVWATWPRCNTGEVAVRGGFGMVCVSGHAGR